MTDRLMRSALAPVTDVDVSTRRVTVRLLRWNDPRPVVDRDASGEVHRSVEAWAPGSIEFVDPVHVVDVHHGALIGRADLDTLDDTGDGPTVELVLANTTRANDTLALTEAQVIRAVSMEVEPTGGRVDDAGVTWRTGRVHGIAFAFRAQLDAPILATRDRPHPTPQPEETRPMSTDTAPDPTPAPSAVDVQTVDRAATADDLDALRDTLHRDLLDELRREAVAVADRADVDTPLHQYRSLDEFAAAVHDASADHRAVLHRALVDQVTANNPGLIPPAWLTAVQGVITQTRPTVTAFRVQPAPVDGMTVDWPYFDGDWSTLVAEQLTEKTEVTSVRVDIKRGDAPLRTWAGGSDISYQTLRRSNPSYRNVYERIMAQGWAYTTEAAAAAAAQTIADSNPADVAYNPATDQVSTFAYALFNASSKVRRATGLPASFVACASDVFETVGSALWSPQYGTQNVAGTADAASLRVSVSGLPVVEAPSLAAGKIMVSNGLAATFYEDGPLIATADVPARLGLDMAVWGMGAFAALIPAGIVSIPAA